MTRPVFVYQDGDLNYPIVEERSWERNDFHYDNVAKAMLTLFVVSTFEGSYSFWGGFKTLDFKNQVWSLTKFSSFDFSQSLYLCD